MTADNASIAEEIHEAGVCVLALSGRIDSTNANTLADRLTRLLATGEKSILVDLRDVRYLTSAAFRALLVARKGANAAGARLALCSVAGHVRELFEIGGLLDVFAIVDSREDGIAHFA